MPNFCAVKTVLRGSELLGLPVIERQSGRRLGGIDDLWLTADLDALHGLVLAPAGWRQVERWIPWVSGADIGVLAVLADIVNGFTHQDAAPVTEPGFRWRKLAGKPIITDRGDELGLLTDLWVGPDGSVVGYQLSRGILEDFFAGQPVLPGPAQVRPQAAALVFSSAAPLGAGGNAYELPKL